MHTDACKDGFAAVLLQRDESEKHLHPVYFWSKATTPAEKELHSYELEALAVFKAVEQLKPYLLEIKFKIVTDCAAYNQTVKKENIPNRVRYMTLRLSDYEFTMEHRAGKRMKYVDALSRNPIMIVEETITAMMKKNQEKDEHLLAIKKILEAGENFEDYLLQNGVVMKNIDGREVLAVPANMQKAIIQRMHEKGHFSKKKTEELVKREYFIPKLLQKTEDVINCCIHCILMERKRGKKEGLLNPIPKDDMPLMTLHIDHLGPMTGTGKGYHYIFVVTDGFSKFSWLYPTKTTTSRGVIEKLELLAKTFGYPKRIISDRGTSFTSGEFTTFCNDKQIEHLLITTGLPRGNGQVERINQIIISVLSKLSIDDTSKWYKHINRVQRCLNSTYQRTINTTPHEALVGVPLRAEDDADVVDILNQELINTFDGMREELRECVRENINKVQLQQKQQYDKKRKEAKVYQVGDIVAIKRTQYGTHMKLRNKYLGPYQVTKVNNNDRYEVKKKGCWRRPEYYDNSS